MTHYTKHPSCYGDLNLTGDNPASMQDDVAMRVMHPDGTLATYGAVKIRDCGLPLRHDSGDLYIETLDCKRFTADLFNSHGNLEIVNLIVDYDGTEFTEEDYEGYHPDALGQFFNHKTKKCGNVKIHNIYARIRGNLIQGFALTEGHDYHNFDIDIGEGFIEIDYKYAFFANTLRDSNLNLGNNGVKILKRKPTDCISTNTFITRCSKDQIIILDDNSGISVMKTKKAEYDRVHHNSNIKVALIVGHNEKSQGASRKGISEFGFWSEFFDSEYAELDKYAKLKGIELKLFFRKYHGRRTYGTEMREVHSRIDQWGGNISISCHFNATESGLAKGHEVLYSRGSKGGYLVAGLFDQAMDSNLNNRDRDRKSVGAGDRGGTGLKVGRAKSILIEPFFAAELPNFVSGGNQRQPLIDSFKDFFESLSKAEKPVIKKRTAHFTDEELQSAMELIG